MSQRVQRARAPCLPLCGSQKKAFLITGIQLIAWSTRTLTLRIIIKIIIIIPKSECTFSVPKGPNIPLMPTELCMVSKD